MPPTGLGYLNPGFIKPSNFYNTNDPAQSKFFWGQHAFQPGPTFNDTLYNTQPNAPDTPYGLQQLARPLTMDEINDMILGKPYTPQTVAPATRRVPITDANRNVMNTDYSKVGQLPVLAPVVPSQAPTTTTTSPINAEIARQLGSNWFNRQQAAATAGDWETYYAIQRQVDAIINPVIDKF
jgi:hypothetical protein